MTTLPAFSDTTTLLRPRAETIEELRRLIEFAPKDPGRIAENLRGWVTPNQVFVCAKCAGRIAARGCSMPQGSNAVWHDEPLPGRCCCC